MSKSTTIELVIQVIANQISGNPNLSMAINDSNEINEKTYAGVMVLNTDGAYDKMFNDRRTLSYG